MGGRLVFLVHHIWACFVEPSFRTVWGCGVGGSVDVGRGGVWMWGGGECGCGEGGSVDVGRGGVWMWGGGECGCGEGGSVDVGRGARSRPKWAHLGSAIRMTDCPSAGGGGVKGMHAQARPRAFTPCLCLRWCTLPCGEGVTALLAGGRHPPCQSWQNGQAPRFVLPGFWVLM